MIESSSSEENVEEAAAAPPPHPSSSFVVIIAWMLPSIDHRSHHRETEQREPAVVPKREFLGVALFLYYAWRHSTSEEIFSVTSEAMVSTNPVDPLSRLQTSTTCLPISRVLALLVQYARHPQITPTPKSTGYEPKTSITRTSYDAKEKRKTVHLDHDPRDTRTLPFPGPPD